MGAAVGAQDNTVIFHFKLNPGKLKQDSSYNFFFFFLLNKKHKLHTQLMQNLNKLKYAFRDPQKGLRVARGQSKVLRNIFKDDTSTLAAAMRNPQLSKTHQQTSHPEVNSEKHCNFWNISSLPERINFTDFFFFLHILALSLCID